MKLIYVLSVLGPLIGMRVDAAELSKSWAAQQSKTFALGPSTTWAKLARQGTRQFTIHKLGLAEQLLRESLEVAQSAGVADERLINLQNSLTEILIAQNKFSEANGWYHKSYDKIKQLKLESEPIAFRTLSLHAIIVDGVGSESDSVIERRNLLALAKRIFGSDSPAYKECMFDAMDYALNKNLIDEALNLYAQLKKEYDGKACVNARLFECVVRLGSKAYDRIWLDKTQRPVTIEILEDAGKASAPFLKSKSEVVFNCYRMLVLTYTHANNVEQAVRCARHLIKIVPSHPSWPNPFSQACMGTAYLALGQRYQNEKPAAAIEYFKKAIEHFSHAPVDYYAYDHSYWAKVGIVQCLIRLQDIDGACKVLMPINPDPKHSWFLNAVICDFLMQVADAAANKGNIKAAKKFCARVSAYMGTETKTPPEFFEMWRYLKAQRDKLEKRLAPQKSAKG